MKEKVSKIVRYILSSCVAILFVWLVARKVDWVSFLEGLRSTRWGYIALFTIVSLLALVFRSLRWRALLKPLGSRNTLLDIWDAINVGNLANVALPGVGEVIRTGFVSKKEPSFEKAFGTIFMERLWDVLAIIVLISAALALKWSDFTALLSGGEQGALSFRPGMIIWAGAGLVLAGTLFIWLCFRYKDRSRLFAKVADAVKGVLDGAASFFKMEKKGWFIIQTVMVWVMYILMSWSGLKAIPGLSSLTMADALFISAVGNLASVIPVPSGMGPYHYLVTLALTSLYGCTGETGLLFAVLCHETHAVIIIAIGVISYLRFTVSNGTKK